MRIFLVHFIYFASVCYEMNICTSHDHSFSRVPDDTTIRDDGHKSIHDETKPQFWIRDKYNYRIS